MYYCNKCGQEMIDSGHKCAVPEANASSQLCAVCAYWLEDPEYKGLGACGNDNVHNQLIFGRVDMFLISGDFGCKYFKRE